MKSIVPCESKITAKDLGVKIGDKFIVLPREDCDKWLFLNNFKVGEVLELIRDDGTELPLFKCVETGKEGLEYFTCLARYEEPKDEKIVLDKVKFDMEAIAEEVGISLKAAHELVQEMLFEEGNKWVWGEYVQYENSKWLFVKHGKITYDEYDSDTAYTQLSLELKKSFVIKKETPPEIITVNGKQYKLID